MPLQDRERGWRERVALSSERYEACTGSGALSTTIFDSIGRPKTAVSPHFDDSISLIWLAKPGVIVNQLWAAVVAQFESAGRGALPKR